MRGGAQGDQLKNRRNSTCYGPSAILMAPRPNIWRPSPLTDLLPTAHHLAEEPRTGPESRGKDPIFTTQGTLLVLKDAVVTEIVEEDLEPYRTPGKLKLADILNVKASAPKLLLKVGE